MKCFRTWDEVFEGNRTADQYSFSEYKPHASGALQ
jgi:hypothetical protein